MSVWVRAVRRREDVAGGDDGAAAVVGLPSVEEPHLPGVLVHLGVLAPHDPAGADGRVRHAALAAAGWRGCDCPPLGGEAWPRDGAVGVHLDGDGAGAGEGAGHGGATELLAEVSVGNLYIVPPTLRVLLNIKRGKGQCGLMAFYWILTPLLQIEILELKPHKVDKV